MSPPVDARARRARGERGKGGREEEGWGVNACSLLQQRTSALHVSVSGNPSPPLLASYNALFLRQLRAFSCARARETLKSTRVAPLSRCLYLSHTHTFTFTFAFTHTHTQTRRYRRDEKENRRRDHGSKQSTNNSPLDHARHHLQQTHRQTEKAREGECARKTIQQVASASCVRLCGPVRTSPVCVRACVRETEARDRRREGGREGRGTVGMCECV